MAGSSAWVSGEVGVVVPKRHGSLMKTEVKTCRVSGPARTKAPDAEATIQSPSGNQAASLKWAAEAEPSELFTFKECEDLFRARLTGPLRRLVAQLTGLRLHVLWHSPLEFQGHRAMPILCPKAQQRPSANSQPPKRCVSCLLRGWKPAFSVGSQGRRFIGRCGATNFCVALEVDKVCPLTLVLQTRVASLNAETQRVAEERREKELSATLCESLRLGVKSPQTASKLGLSSAGEPVSPAAFHRAVALVRLILHDLASTAHARLARSGLEKAMRRLNHTQTEVARLREEMHHRLPGLPESTVQPGLQSHAQNLVDAMFNYVHQHYFRPIGLGDLASAMKMNASYLSALFSQTTGVTFHHFLEEVRLSKAKALLSDPRNLVCDVACAAGYASPDAFRHAFKAHEGLSPETWRAGQ